LATAAASLFGGSEITSALDVAQRTVGDLRCLTLGLGLFAAGFNSAITAPRSRIHNSGNFRTKSQNIRHFFNFGVLLVIISGTFVAHF
jgi:Mn2+/Fe2+ NRAMP family transporter